MTTQTSRIRRLISALRPFQDPNLKPWSPESYAHRPNILVQSLGVAAIAVVMGFGLMGANEPQFPNEVVQSEVEAPLQASVIDDVVDLIEELLGLGEDEQGSGEG